MKEASRTRRLLCAIFLIACAASAVASAQGTLVQAGERFRLDLIIEAAGLFWIGAEVAILFCMTTAVRIFATRPLPARMELTAAERRRGLLWGAAFAALVVAIFGRHLAVTPLPAALQAIAESGVDVREGAGRAYLRHAHTHVAVWCGFITAWVALEIAIVAQGLRAYRKLTQYLHDGPVRNG